MPHIAITMFPGRDDKTKEALAGKMKETLKRAGSQRIGGFRVRAGRQERRLGCRDAEDSGRSHVY